MEVLIDKFVTLAKTLPGLGLAILVATLGYMYLKDDFTKLSPRETFVTAVVCWLLYHAASLLDRGYDALYRPKSASGLWGLARLEDSRNRAAKALFFAADRRVTDYASAVTWRHIGDPPLKSLYSLCSKVAKATEAWHKKIEPVIAVSKAARTAFAFTLIGTLILAAPALRDMTGLGMYVRRLGPWSNPWMMTITSAVAFVVYVVLRIEHNLRLYDYVAGHVRHIPVENGVAAAIFEVTMPKREGAPDDGQRYA
jgi:hypothetical protein